MTLNGLFSTVSGANMKFIEILRKSLKQDLFTQEDLKMLMPEMTETATHSAITRSLKDQKILKLKRGLYLFAKDLRKQSLSNFLAANKLYGPSYISFESALSYHGLIPEAVYTTTSACFQRKKKSFRNILGDFTFDYIPCDPFFMGVENIQEKGGVLIANPLKALFDLIYLKRSIYNSVEELEQDLRIGKDLLAEVIERFSFLEIETLAKSYKKNNVMDFSRMLLRTFK